MPQLNMEKVSIDQHTQPKSNTQNSSMAENDSSDLNKLLRGEISAIEAYIRTIEKFANDPDLTTLIRIKDDHVRTVTQMRNRLELKGVPISEDSGPWGTFVSTFVTSAKLMGKDATLKALLTGEEHGLEQCREMLDSEELTQLDIQMLETDIIPRIKSHIFSLEAMLKN